MAQFKYATTSIRLWSWLMVAIAAMTAALLIGAAGSASAQALSTPFGPSITSDKLDYAPGEHVLLSGAGWQPGETVSVYVEDDQNKTWFRNVDVTADDVGRISDEFDLPTWFVATYSVTATGRASGVVQTSFTDAGAAIQGLSDPPCTGNAQCDNGWSTNNIAGRGENETIPMQMKITGALSNEQFQISFDRTLPSSNGTVLGVERLDNFVAGSGVTITSAVTACDQSGPVWAVCFKASTSGTTNTANPKFITFDAFMAVGAHNFTGSSMSISADLPSGSGSVQVSKPTLEELPPGNPDLKVTKTCVSGCSSATGPNTANAGSNVTYQLDYTNLASDAGTTVVLRDILSGNETYVSCSPACAVSGGSPNTLSWSIGSLAQNETGTVTVVAQLTSNSGVAVTNRANITSPQADSATANNDSSITTTTVEPSHTSSTSVSCVPNPVTYGGNSTCTVTVTDTSASNKTAPGGTVTFGNGTANGSFSSSTCTLTSPTATSRSCSVTYTPNAVGTGTHAIGASYGGDSAHNTSSGSTNLTVAKADQTITFAAPSGVMYGDADVDPGATASSGLAVSYSSSTTSNCTIVSGKIHIVGAGTCTVTASQAGNDNYNAAPSVERSFAIAKADQTITFVAPSGKNYLSADFDPGATASSGLAVSYSSSTTGNCTIVSGKIHIVGAGTCTVTASQAGNDNYNAAPSVERSFAIAKADQTITFVAPSGKNYLSADFDPGATASSGLAVSYSSSTTSNCTIVSGEIHIVGAGTCTVTASQAGNDNYSAAPSVERSFTIAKATTTLSLAVAPASVQYSDTVNLGATINPAIAGSVQFQKSTNNGVSYSNIGGPVEVSSGSAALNNQQINDAPGTAVKFKATFDPTDTANYASSSDDKPLAVTREDAGASYTGPMFLFTPSVSTGAVTVPLRATIQDATALASSDSRYDNSSGDIRKATVQFVVRDAGSMTGLTNNQVLCTATLTLIDAADLKTATATCPTNPTFNIGSQDSLSATIGIAVDGHYVRSSPDDDTLITISRPIASQFITGGGYLLLDSTSGGTYKGDAGSRNNFGFNVKYNSKGTSLQGRVNTIIRRGGRVYQVKANNLLTLGVSYCKPGATAGTVASCTKLPAAPCTVNASSTCPIQSTFTGSASIQDVTKPTAPVSIEGGATVQLNMIDFGEPGSNGPGPDQLGITVWTKSNALWYSSRWSGSNTLMQMLNGGNLVVH